MTSEEHLQREHLTCLLKSDGIVAEQVLDDPFMALGFDAALGRGNNERFHFRELRNRLQTEAPFTIERLRSP
jgi:hypothetical protein